MKQWYLAAGDFGFYWAGQIRALSWLPQVFRTDMELGRSQLDVMWFAYPFRLILKALDSIGLSWWEIEKIIWLSVFIIGIYSSYSLAKYIFQTRLSSCIVSFIYITNTYFLSLLGGRQLGVALGYCLSPLVLLKFIQYINSYCDVRCTKYDVRKIIENGLLLALLVCFDIRLAYLVTGAVGIYLVLRIMYEYGQKTGNNKQSALSVLCYLFFALCIAGMVHLFWILPLIMVRGGFVLSQDFINTGMLKFLSVADFSHALSLLHPNWPENLFGKVYFLQPEFLILPIMAFSSLLFVHIPKHNTDSVESIKYLVSSIKYKNIHEKLGTKNQHLIIFFALLALVGVFLAKGTHEPFGGVFVWLFEHIPGFVMFRDPTKFYLFIALGYSVLIPYTLLQVSHWINDKGLLIKDNTNKTRSFIMCLSSFIFIVYWLFTLRALFTGQTLENFKPLVLTQEYVVLKDMIINDIKPYRTLWIPRADKFLYSSDIHPVLSAGTLWKNASAGALLAAIEMPEFFKTIKDAGVRYIIVPQDLEKRIFLSDYRYDKRQRDMLIKALDQTGLRRLPEFQGLSVFENPTYTFQVDIPQYVKKQEYWSIIGLYISGSTLIVLTVCVWILSRKPKIS